MFYRMFQLYSLELAVVTVFGQVPEFLKGESTELMRAIETLAAVSHRKFLYLHHPVIELFVESESPYTILKASQIGFVEFLCDVVYFLLT